MPLNPVFKKWLWDNEITLNTLQFTQEVYAYSGVASLKIYSRNANLFVFIHCENNQFVKQ